MEQKRNGFASGIGFVLAAAGSAVGLGNLWGFPYKTHAYGGAAFVLVYIACVLFIGVVTMICEIFIGKRAQANPVTAFKQINKNFSNKFTSVSKEPLKKTLFRLYLKAEFFKIYP